MKVGERQQQGRGKKKLEVCPNCQKQYLENWYGNKKRKFVIVGLYCPSNSCSYCKKTNFCIESAEKKEI